jgi:fibronectin type 3 domain-containing protein
VPSNSIMPRYARARLTVLCLLLASSLSGLVQVELFPTGRALAATGDPVIAVGGDIACPPGKTVDVTHCQQGKTGALLTAMNPVAVLPLGDSQYDSGTTAEYSGSYDPTGWGTKKSISRPSTGNHEYRTPGATDYYAYFGPNAGDPQMGYYSWDVPVPNAAAWHMIALNSECAVLGGGSISAGCGAGSSQEVWLRADLAAHPNQCIVAYWHRPRFSSSTTTPSSTTYTAFWNDLYSAGADVVLNGHAHDYERFAPQTSAGVSDPAKGITEFVVGSGGVGFQTMGPGIANSVVRNASAFGVMKMTLHASSYDFEFVPASGYALADSGTNIPCHNAPGADTSKPSAPTNLTAAAASAAQVNLSWTAATDNVGVTNYNIYRGSNGATPALIATTTNNATTFADTAVTADTAYTYQVSAQDAAGNIGPVSVAATVTTPGSSDTTPPTAPSALAAEVVLSNEIDLGWTGSTDTGTGVSGYKVYRQGPGETVFTLLATTTGTGAGHNSYVDLTVKPSSAYQYFVTAYDGANNESAHSNTVSATTPSGLSTKSVTFTASADSTIDQTNHAANAGTSSTLLADNSPVDDIMMKFDVAISGCETLTSATLQLRNNADGSVKGGDFYTTGTGWTETGVTWDNAPTRGSLLNSLGAVSKNAVVTVDVTQGVTSLNAAAAFRIGNTSPDSVQYWSNNSTKAANRPKLTVVCTNAPVADNTPPSAPSSLTASAGTSGEIDLSWLASTDNVGVTGYNIYRGGSQLGTVAASSLTYQDTTVIPGTTYTYTVKAVDAAGNLSLDSNTATATAPTAPPAPPTNLQASVTGSTVDLSWTASTGQSVTGYNVYRGPQGGTLTQLASTASTSYTDTVAEGSYDYAVTAVTTGGTESARSNVVTVTVGPAATSIGVRGAAAVTLISSAATSWTVTLPAYVAGDFVVISLGNNLGSTAGTPASSGWTTYLRTNESSGLKGSFLGRRMSGTEGASISVTWTLATLGVAEAVAFTGVSVATPVDVTAVGQAEASTTAVSTHTTPLLTSVTNGVVLVSGFVTDVASTWTSADTEIADATVGNVSAALYYSAPVPPGSYSRSATATAASVKAVSSLLALRPA